LCKIAKTENPKIHIIVRTRFVNRNLMKLRKLGANEVIPEEFETSLEIFQEFFTTLEYPEIKLFKCLNR